MLTNHLQSLLVGFTLLAATSPALAQDIAVVQQNVALPTGSLPNPFAGTYMPPCEISDPSQAFFLVKNLSLTTPLTINSVTLTGTHADQFQLETPPASIQPNSATSLTFYAAPTTAGAKSATLTINTNDPDTPAYQVHLALDAYADGTMPPLPQLSFGNVNPPSTTKARKDGTFRVKCKVDISNHGDGLHPIGTVDVYHSQSPYFEGWDTPTLVAKLKKMEPPHPVKGEKTRIVTLKATLPTDTGYLYAVARTTALGGDADPRSNLIKISIVPAE